MSSDSEFDENAASDHQSDSEENGIEETEEATTSNDQTNGENTENLAATWNDLVSLAQSHLYIKTELHNILNLNLI